MIKYLKTPAFLWIIGLIICLYAGLNTSGAIALDINFHDVYYVVSYDFLAIAIAVIFMVLGFIFWASKRSYNKRGTQKSARKNA